MKRHLLWRKKQDKFDDYFKTCENFLTFEVNELPKYAGINIYQDD